MTDFWCPWDEMLVDPNVSPDHACLAPDEHEPVQGDQR